MKHFLVLVSLAVMGGVLALATDAGAQTFKPSVVTVARIKGEARYSLGDNQWHPLVVGKVLGAGTVIQTAADSVVDLVLSGNGEPLPQARPTPDSISYARDSEVRGMVTYRPTVAQNVIRMWGDTVLGIDKLTVSDTGADTISDTELDLRSGRIFGSVKKISAASQYIIRIPNGVAGIRGTSFTISADGVVTVFTGCVVFSYIGPDGRPVTQVINGGFRYDLQTGQMLQVTQEELVVLKEIAIATETLYEEIVSFTYDRTFLCISPTTGNHHHHGHWWWPWW
jgi:hypothetical protein